jgi:hypothetical protein
MPTGLNGVSRKVSSLTLTWNAVSGATAYTLKYSNIAGGAKTKLVGPASFTNISLQFTTFARGQSWYFVVSASNAERRHRPDTGATITGGEHRIIYPAAQRRFAPITMPWST